jgi:MFS family permease
VLVSSLRSVGLRRLCSDKDALLTRLLPPVPLYQSETAPKWIRGFIVGAYQWAITIGLLLAAVVNNATAHRNDSGSYRIPIAIQLAWSLILFGGMILLPETPRYLIKRDNMEKAAKSLSRLRSLPVDHTAIQAELAEVRANHEYEMSLGSGSYLDCFRPPLLKRQFTGMALQALQQLTGTCSRLSLSTSTDTNLPQASTSSSTTAPSTSRTRASPAASSSP